MTHRQISQVIHITPTLNGLGWVRLDRAVGRGGQPYDDWKFGVSLQLVKDRETARELQEEALEDAGLDPDQPCELAETWLDIGAKASHDDEGTFGFWRTSGTFRLEHGDVHITDGHDGLYTPTSGDDDVQWVAHAVGLDRLVRAVLGIGIAQVEAAESVLRQLDDHGPDDWTWHTEDPSRQDPALHALEQEFETTTKDEVVIPGVGTAHRRRLPALRVNRLSPGYARWRAQPTTQNPTFTVPACDVWLVALKTGAKVPSQQAFDNAGWPEPRDDSDDSEWGPSSRRRAEPAPDWIERAILVVPVVILALLVAAFFWIRSQNAAEREAQLAEIRLELEERRRNGPPKPLALDLDGAPRLGPADATVTVVEMGVLDSSPSRRDGLEEQRAAHPDEVAHVFLHAVSPDKDDPLHEQAAVAGVCADAQEKFWSYRREMEASHHPLSASFLRRCAEAAGLRMSEWDACVADTATLERVRAESARNLKHRTGAINLFVVNGKPTPRSWLGSSIKSALTDARK